MRRHAGPLLRSLDLFDIYRGRPLIDTEKTLAWRLTYSSDERTLTESEIDDSMEAVWAGLASDIGGRKRS
jgi:phenylalanyl-tRNA synthetase beta chain